MTQSPSRQVEPKELAGYREALRQSEQRFELLVQSVREYAIFMMDQTGHIVTWNPGAERINGYTAQEIIGKHFSIFYPAEAIEEDKPAWELRVAIREGFFEEEGWRVRKDGSQFWTSVVITALFGHDGSHIGFAKVTRDLTDRRRQEESQRRLARMQLLESEGRFASFAEHLPGLAWIKDLEGRYTYVNHATAEAFRRERSDIYGRTDADLFEPAIATQLRANDARVMSEEAGVQATTVLPGPDGDLRHSIVTKFPITDAEGRLHLIGGIGIDITDRVRAEDALREADNRKNEFLATLSHELRNPLAPICNAVHLLKADTPEVPRERVHRMLEQQLEHMVRLIDDLLEVSRITSGKVEMRREPVALAGVLQAAIDASMPLIQRKQHRLITDIPDEPVVVQGDAVRLAQVVVNLLNNASKYTPDGGEIRLGLERRDDEAVITVRDTGAGIPQEMLPRVFDMFTQVDRTLRRSQGGLGIGLALARNLVDMHGGKISVQSYGLDLGTEFTVRLACINDVVEPPYHAVAPTQISDSIKVLVVDDSRDGADTLVMVLDAMQFDARATYDGPSALSLVRSWMPAFVLLDIGMPGMDGYEVARRIRAQPTLNGVHLIALTGWGAADDRVRSQEAGFDDHWVKPIDPAKLQGLLARRVREVQRTG